MAYGNDPKLNFKFKNEEIEKDANATIKALSNQLPDGINLSESISYIDATALARGRHKEQIMSLIENMSIFTKNESIANGSRVRWLGQAKQKISNARDFRQLMNYIRALNKYIDEATPDHKFTWSIVNYAKPFA